MIGFSFNGVHSSSLGLIMKSKNRPILPEPKIITEDVPFRNGVYDFSAVNPSGRIMYKQREITIDCSFISSDPARLRKKAREIAAWLSCGESKLVFDDECCVYYLATVSNHIDLEQQIAKIGSFTIVFSCRPLAYSFTSSGVVPSYSSGLRYDNMACYGGSNIFNITGNEAFTVVNHGTYVKPKIILEGSFQNVTISFGENYINFSEQSSGTLTFDCENLKAVLNSFNVTNRVKGSFFELSPGYNDLSITADAINCTLRFVFKYLFL